MKYEVEVRFYAYRDNKQMELYKRYFSIEADDAKHAAMAVHNILSVMEFHNFEILRVSENEH